MASSSSQLERLPEEDYDQIYGSESGWVEARTSCDHLASLSSDLTHIPTPHTPCHRCQHPSENWLCLSCKDVLCSRFVNKHMLQHSREANHSVALGLSDLSVWCFSCDAYLDAQVIPQLRPVYAVAYRLKFGSLKARTSCDHLASLSPDLTRIPACHTPCHRCQRPSESWLCLSCKDVLCSRFVNKHMLQHSWETNHSVALSFSDLSVWCFSCNAFLDAQVIPQLRPVYEVAYRLIFGEGPPFRAIQHPSVGDEDDDDANMGGTYLAVEVSPDAVVETTHLNSDPERAPVLSIAEHAGPPLKASTLDSNLPITKPLAVAGMSVVDTTLLSGENATPKAGAYFESGRGNCVSILEIEAHLADLPRPLPSEFHDVLVPFLSVHPSMLLSTTPLHRGSAYAALGEFLLLTRQNYIRSLASSRRAKFSSLLATLRDFTFDSDWLGEVEQKVLTPPEDSPLGSLVRVVVEKEAVYAEVGHVAEEIAHLKVSLASKESSHRSLIERHSALADEEARLVAVVDVTLFNF